MSNLICAKKFLNKIFPNKNIEYINSDIAYSKLYASSLENKLWLVVAKNLIQFLDGNQINNFFVNSFKNLKEGGILFLVFENPILNKQLEVIEQINKKINDGNFLDETGISFLQNFNCSIEKYKETSPIIRSSGFPCIVVKNNISINYLVPNEVQRLLIRAGFRILLNDKISLEQNKLIIAQKP